MSAPMTPSCCRAASLASRMNRDAVDVLGQPEPAVRVEQFLRPALDRPDGTNAGTRSVMRAKSTRYERGSLPASPVITTSEPGTTAAATSAMSLTCRLVAGMPDVEGGVEDGVARRLEAGDERGGDVAGVHERTPRGAVGQHPHVRRSGTPTRRGRSARCRRAAAARSRTRWRCAGRPVRRSSSASSVQVVLDPHLAHGVRGDRRERGGLVDQRLAARTRRTRCRSRRRGNAGPRRRGRAGPAGCWRGG